MSLQFSDTTNYQGILQRIEDRLGFEYGDITNNTGLKKKFTAKINAYQNKMWAKIFNVTRTWQWDDVNHEDNAGNDTYPIIKRNLVSGQRDYPFTLDENNNLILDVFKVAILPSATSTIYQELEPFDELNDQDNDIVAERANTGVPLRYGKLANGIFLDTPTSYNATNGLKLYINREGYYFNTSDTTKKPGFDGRLHEYLVIGPAYEHAVDNSLRNTEQLFRELTLMEQMVDEVYAGKEKDVRRRVTGKKINFI